MAAEVEVSNHTQCTALLQPEIMSKEDLISALNQKQITKCDFSNLDKDALLEVYYKSILPVPQRKYRLNRRGQVATKQQITQARSRKRSFEKISVSDTESESTTNRAQPVGLITSFRPSQSTPAGDRLKPVNPDRKVIRLKPKSPDTSLSAIVINQRNTFTPKNVTKSDTKSPENGNKSIGHVEKAPECTAKSRVIKLNRISFSSESNGEVTKKSSTVSPVPRDLSPEVKSPKEPAAKKSSTPEDEKATKRFKTVSIKWP